MAIDWEAYKKKAKKLDEDNYQKNIANNDIAPIRTTTTLKDDDIAPVRPVTTVSSKKEKERTWFQKSEYFADGKWDKGDLTKTILGSLTDVGENLGTGIIGMGEKTVDALAMVGNAMSGQALNQAAQDEMIYNVVTGKNADNVLGNYQAAQREVTKGTVEFVKKDLYNEEAVAKKIISAPVKEFTGVDSETDSVFGEKSDALVQSGGQLLGTAGLQAIGIPWYLTTGATAFGSQSEEALKEGATYEEAMLSSAVSAGAEILTEKLSGGIKFGGKTLDDVLTKPLLEKISNKAVKALVNIGLDATGEGAEEVISGVMSNLGTALYKEEDLSEILASEEALDEYLESFIGGAVLGGGSSAVTQVANRKAVELTENEQKVFDKEVENRIAEVEKDGKKVTKKEESAIRQAVLNDLLKGYISIDTIESALGGETYDSYKSVTEQEENLQNEFKTLNQMKQGEMTGEQIDRRAELKQQLEEVKNKSNRSQIKEQLSNEVFELAKDSRLAESYNEKSRRGQSFEADLSKYDAKQQEVIKKAVESGILNNTNRTHEFVDMIAKISADKGVLFDFVNNEKLKTSGFAVEGKTVNGYKTDDGNIALNMQSQKALESVVGHEITHILEGTELYSALQEVVKQYATTKGEYSERMQSLRKLYTGVYKGTDFDAKLQAELTADIVGDYLFSDSDFINSLSTEQPNLFKKIYNEIKYLYKIATAGSKEARELEKVKRAFEQAYKDSGTVQKNTVEGEKIRYSLNDNLENVGKILYDNNNPLAIVNRAKSNNNSSINWVYKSEIFSVTENKLFHEKISEINQGSQAFEKNSRDEYMLPIGNKIIFTDGNYESPYIREIIEVLTEYQTEFEKIKERIFDVEKGESEKQDAVRTIKQVFGDEIVVTYRSGNNGVYGWENGKRKGKNRRTVVRNYLNKQYRTGNDKQSQETPINEIASTNETSSKDGVFSNAEKTKYSLSNSDNSSKDVFGFAVKENAKVNEDLLEELSIYHPDAQVDSDGNVTVYHRTSKENADKIRKTGVMTALEDALFFSSKSEGYASDYGDTVVAFKIPSTVLRVNDIFDGEVHFDIPLKRINNQWSLNVSKYLVDENTTDTQYSLSEETDYSRMLEMQNELTQLRISIHEIEMSDEFKAEQRKLSEAFAGDVDNAIKLYKKWVEESEYGKLKSKKDALQEEFDKLRKKAEEDYLSKALEEEKNAIAKSGLSEADYFRKQAVKEFGYTPYFYDAGYITPNGKMLNFSGEKGKHYGSRGQDHRGISTIYAETSGTDALNRFVKDGNIRIMAESPGIDISTAAEPTKEQYATIRRFIYEYIDKEYFDIDFTDESGKVIGSLQYENRINPTRILNDIKHFYATGEIRGQSDIEKYLYSLSEEGEQPTKNGRFYGKDMLLDLPIREDIVNKPIREDEANAMLQEQNDIAPLTDADVPPEIVAPIYDGSDTKIDDTALKGIGQRLRETLSLTAKETKAIQEVVQKYSTTGLPDKTKIFDDIKEEFGEKRWKERNEEIAEIKRTLKGFKINVSDKIKSDIPDFSDWKRRHQGRLNFSKDGLTVDDIYMGLSISYPGLFPEDIINPTDQLLRMAEIADNDIYISASQEVDNDTIQQATDIIFSEVNKYKENELAQQLAEEQSHFYKSLAEETTENQRIQTVKERLNAKLENVRKELLMNQQLRDDSISDFEQEITRLQAVYDGKRDKNTKVANDILRRIERLQTMKGNVDADFSKRISDLNEKKARLTKEMLTGESPTEQGAMRRELHESIIKNIKNRFEEKGFRFDDVFRYAKNLSTFATVDNTPQRVMEKALGYKQGQILADETVNKVAQNESKGIKWLNSFTDKKNGLLAQISKEYHIKPGSKKSAAAQMYAEGFYVDENNDIIFYGDKELEIDFPDATVRQNIKGLASDPRIRQIYDETLDAINESRIRNAYPEIKKLDNYFLHFRAMEDTFSRLGLPFNPNDIKAKDLPTDLNGVTADLKPGQPYFASAKHRMGKRTSFDLLGGLERYLSSAKNQIYHIDDIQTLRALRNYIADTYGQAHAFDDIDSLTEEEVQERLKEVYNSHLSTFAKFLNEEANVIAGKTALIDRGLEGIIGRRGITVLDTINKQVGSNMVGFNISSSLTNFLSVAQSLAKNSKHDSLKAFTQMASNKISTLFGKSDGFAESNPGIVRRKGAENFASTPYEKAKDVGYLLASAVDNVATEFIVRTKFNEFTRKGMSEEQAHIEADKWASRLLGDRSLGQQPQLYNSKMLGLFTKFQLEVRNQLDTQFYDTIQEAKVSNEEIENAIKRNAKTAAKVGSTFVQLAILQHLFGKAFESVAGYNPAFDIIDVLIKTFGFDDDEEDEDTPLDNLEQGFLALLEDLPYTSTLTGGRIPISSALPIKELVTGEDDYGTEKSRVETLKETIPYYLLPGGYGQIKKTAQGLKMFDDDLPIAGSYTDSGNLRFPVEDTPKNKIQAALFGQYANENAKMYFDNDIAPLKEKQIQEYIDVDLPIADYWKYREGLKGLETLNEKGDYIGDLDLPISKKNILINNIADRNKPIDYTDFDLYSDFEEFDFATRYPEKYKVLKEQGISVDEYKEKYEEKSFIYTDDFSWASDNPEKYTLSKAITDDVTEYKQYTTDLYNIKADKDSNGKSISGSKKNKVLEYINNLDVDYGAKCILLKSQYPSDDTYNKDIVDYLKGRDDITFEEKKTILEELGATVDDKGYIRW